MEPTVETPLGETRGSIRAVSKLAVSIRQLAPALCVNETKRRARVERRVGDMGCLSYSSRSYLILLESRSRYVVINLTYLQEVGGTSLRKDTATTSKERANDWQ